MKVLVLGLGFGLESRVFWSLIRLKGGEEEEQGWSEAVPLRGQARRNRSEREKLLRVSTMIDERREMIDTEEEKMTRV